MSGSGPPGPAAGDHGADPSPWPGKGPTGPGQACPGPSAASVRHMLLWINGPFGDGKTATAHELNRRLPGRAVHHLTFTLLAEPATIAQVADAIASSAGLAITPSTDGLLRTSLRRHATIIRHIRFDQSLDCRL
jgi:hypothetical protein